MAVLSSASEADATETDVVADVSDQDEPLDGDDDDDDDDDDDAREVPHGYVPAPTNSMRFSAFEGLKAFLLPPLAFFFTQMFSFSPSPPNRAPWHPESAQKACLLPAHTTASPCR